MAVGLSPPGPLPPVGGIRVGTAAAAVKTPDRLDLAVIEAAPGSTCAAVFTTNAFAAAPVTVARAHLAAGSPRYLLVNSGNANAGTGPNGVADAERTCAALAAAVDCPPAAVLPFSTGVIGERLPAERIAAAIPAAVAALDPGGWDAAARAIMTTDTVPKGASRRFTQGSETRGVVGIAKGAGMIRPDMATMLAFVATDAGVGDEALATCLADAADRSFHRITVDGDTSTNDACVLLATGAAPRIEDPDDPRLAEFRVALNAVCTDLARAIVRDGEGATKFVTVSVEGGADLDECRRVAFTVAHSPLVKTALFASDPNWGRILAAVGRAGVAGLDIDRVRLTVGDVLVVAGGGVAPTYEEAAGAAAMAVPEITIRIDLGRGDASTAVWTSDFSYDYVRINAEYRT